MALTEKNAHQEMDRAVWTASTPLRLSFGGGGTDLDDYSSRFGGFVVSVTLDRYITTRLELSGDQLVHIESDAGSAVLDPERCEEIPVSDPLSYTKSIVGHCRPSRGVSLSMSSSLPMGTGLGSSGSMGVNLVGLLTRWAGETLDRDAIAERAYRIEREDLGRVTGRQDHYAAAHGGFNKITFHRDRVDVRPLALPPGMVDNLEARILLFHSGGRRDSSPIARQQQERVRDRERAALSRLDRIRSLGQEMADRLEAGDLDALGDLLHRSWVEKREVAGRVSTPRIDDLYRRARDAGAMGGKICGAGGGGVLMFYCHPERQEEVREELRRAEAQEVLFRFENHGLRVEREGFFPSTSTSSGQVTASEAQEG